MIIGTHFFKMFFFRLQMRVISLFRLFQSKAPILKCEKCHWVLHAPKRATEITNTLCWLCFYKAHIGYIPTLPKLTDFSIYRDLFKKNIVVHDDIWSGQMLYKGLIENGRIAKEARANRESLTSNQRDIITTVRSVARERGYSWLQINDTEMKGAGYFIQ